MSGSDPLPCAAAECDEAADFRFYDRGAGRWSPRCERHALEVHPSLELHVLLEAGYLRPVEVGAPGGPPDDPPTGRSRAFRELVEDLLGR